MGKSSLRAWLTALPFFDRPCRIKKVVQVVASTKPYIYQHVSDATLHVTLPGASEETLIEGTIFDELTFIS
jgi:hypothetical protein